MTKWQVEKNLKVSSSLRKRNIDEYEDDTTTEWWEWDYNDYVDDCFNRGEDDWEWYMLVDEKKQEGYETVTVNRMYTEEEVKEWLTEMGIKHIYMHPVYLLYDQMSIMMMALKFT